MLYILHYVIYSWLLRQWFYLVAVRVAVRVTRSETRGFVVHWHLIYERRSWSSKLSRSSVGMKERAVHTVASRGSLAALQRSFAPIAEMEKSGECRSRRPVSRTHCHVGEREKEREKEMYVCACMYMRKLILAQSHFVSFNFVLITLKRFSPCLLVSFLHFFSIRWRRNGPYFCIPPFQFIGAQSYGIWQTDISCAWSGYLNAVGTEMSRYLYNGTTSIALKNCVKELRERIVCCYR